MPLAAARGMTLVEVTFAAAVLAVTVAAASAATLYGLRAHAHASRSGQARLRATNEAERLRALPFWNDAESGSGGCDDLVSVVFPHAVVERNTEVARYVGLGDATGSPGSFVTVAGCEGGRLTTVARFVVATPSGWRPAAAEVVTGFRADAAERPPAAALWVSVSYASGAGRQTASCATSFVVVARSGSGSRLGQAPAPDGSVP